ncbi:MAG: hypothetical protein JO166_04290 [Deltaproteobacteria bacterium]|nr:hypothetical protein [Deltaproteobacteria bacterium]
MFTPPVILQLGGANRKTLPLGAEVRQLFKSTIRMNSGAFARALLGLMG